MNFLDYLNFINRLQVPPGNYGVSRKDMPQIEDLDDFKLWLRDQGVAFGETDTPVGSLKLCQNEVNKDKVAAMVRTDLFNDKPIVTSSDGFVLDGTHRFVLHYNCGMSCDPSQYVIPTLTVDLPLTELLPLAKTYPGATFKDVQDKTQ